MVKFKRPCSKKRYSNGDRKNFHTEKKITLEYWYHSNGYIHCCDYENYCYEYVIKASNLPKGIRKRLAEAPERVKSGPITLFDFYIGYYIRKNKKVYSKYFHMVKPRHLIYSERKAKIKQAEEFFNLLKELEKEQNEQI